jgi:predicted SnoaL-like aldol condensation-catalyzing enzyme
MASSTEANKAAVRAFCDLSFNQRKPEEAVAKYVGGMYRQHNPMAGDGPQPFIQFVKWFAGSFPEMKVTFKRILADGDMVAVHSHITRGKDDRGQAVVDLFRLENGKIVEHWDVIQEIPEKAENTNTMF